MEDIAEAAGLSRATVYRHFDGREGVLLGVAERDIDRYLARLGQRLDRATDVDDALLTFSTSVIRAARRDKTLALLFGQNQKQDRRDPLSGGFDLLFGRTVSFLQPHLERWQQAGALPADLNPSDAAEWVVRMVTSLIMVPGLVRRHDAELETFLRSFLLPALLVRRPDR